jgi:hypothetical protein
MTVSVSINVTGTLEEVGEVFDAIRGALPDSGGVTLETSSKIDVLHFIGLLTDVGRRAIGSLAIHAVNGDILTRDDWQDATHVDEPDEFNGVLGGIGRAWARSSTLPNPFASLGTNDAGEHFHGIRDRELADELWRIITDRYSQ